MLRIESTRSKRAQYGNDACAVPINNRFYKQVGKCNTRPEEYEQIVNLQE